MAKSDLSAMLAAATAGKAATRVPTGVGALDAHDFRALARGADLRKARALDFERAERLAERRFEVGAAAANAGDRAFASEVAGGFWDHVL